MSQPPTIDYLTPERRSRRYFAWIPFVSVMLGGSGPIWYWLIAPIEYHTAIFRDFGMKLPGETVTALWFLNLYVNHFGWIWDIVAASAVGFTFAAFWPFVRVTDRRDLLIWCLSALLVAAVTVIYLQRVVDARPVYDLLKGISGSGNLP